MKKLKVNQDMCIGCGFCVQSFPDLFEFEGGLSKEKVAKVTDDNKEAVTASEGCPTGAIVLEDVEDKKNEDQIIK